jgi:fructose-1,6-bisphosphatase II
MRPVLGSISMRGTGDMSEGEKDQAPMLYNGEQVGNGDQPEVDIAVDPMDSTTLAAKSLPNAPALVALTERGSMFKPGPCVYMEARRWPRLRRRRGLPGTHRGQPAARGPGQERQRGGPHRVHPRPARHEAELVSRVRQTGTRIKFLLDGDVAGPITAAEPSTGMDLLVGIGGTPDASSPRVPSTVLAAPSSAGSTPGTTPNAAGRTAGLRPVRDTHHRRLVSGQKVFFAATGISDGEPLRGVRYTHDEVRF